MKPLSQDYPALHFTTDYTDFSTSLHDHNQRHFPSLHHFYFDLAWICGVESSCYTWAAGRRHCCGVAPGLARKTKGIPDEAKSEDDLLNIFRNTMVTGALLIYARYVAVDKRPF